MSEPRRLRDVSGSSLESALLSAGASYRSSPEAHEKTLAALGLASTAVVSAGAASGASALLSKLSWTKLLSVLSLGVAVVAPVGYFALRDAEPVAVSSVRIVAAPNVAATPAAPEAQAAEPEPVGVEVGALPALEAPRSAGVNAPRVAPTKADSVAAELGVIDSARAALARGDAAGALSRLDGYARSYPRGRLALEAEVLRIDALSQSGQSSLAAKRAEAFLRRHPGSVLASRVRGYLKD
ncbi:MAG: hypothetical protein QM756_46585 [Polyangiaceae bacterium]